MKRAHTSTTQKGDFDRAKKLRAAKVRAIGIEDADPSRQLGQRQRCEHVLELSPAGSVEHGFVKEWLEQRSEIESSPTDDERDSFLIACLVDPAVGILGPGCRRIPLGRVDDVDPAVRNGRALGGIRLGGTDIESTIDLP
jgi:hypothetical protein